VINQNLHLQPAGLDPSVHGKLRLKVPINEWGVASKLNAMFVAAAEFGDTCREFPIVFVNAGKDEDGKDSVAPIAVFGLSQNDNLFLTGERWRANYMPAVLRMYPFCIARIDAERFAVCIDTAYKGLNELEGEPLFTPDGQLSELTSSLQKQLEVLEAEIQRTRMVCRRLLELGLLRDMRFDATLPDGRQHTVDGFLTVDEEKMNALPDAEALELHRSGLAGLVHMHWVSMGNMRRLTEWHVERAAAAPAPVSAPPAVAANSAA
jgi:hypothetical protein